MYRIAWVFMIACALLWGPDPVAAGGLESSKSLLCQSDEGKAYHAGGEMRPFNPESVGLAKKFVIDLKHRVVRPTTDSYVQRRSRILQIVYIESKMILLGAEDGVEGVEDGVGWTAAISRETGRFTVSAAGTGVGYTVFGTCTPE